LAENSICSTGYDPAGADGGKQDRKRRLSTKSPVSTVLEPNVQLAYFIFERTGRWFLVILTVTVKKRGSDVTDANAPVFASKTR
jgi:hypothetical protein